MKKIIKWLGNAFTVFLILVIVFAIFTMVQAKKDPNYIPSFMGYKPLSILSGSMRPNLEVGDMIFVKSIDGDKVQEGDVITFWVDEDTLVTHRVVEIMQQDDGNRVYRTKGDANNVEDHQLVAESQLLGKLMFDIPKGGYAAKFARSSKGLILFIIIPIFILIASELRSVWLHMGKEQKKNVASKDHL